MGSASATRRGNNAATRQGNLTSSGTSGATSWMRNEPALGRARWGQRESPPDRQQRRHRLPPDRCEQGVCTIRRVPGGARGAANRLTNGQLGRQHCPNPSAWLAHWHRNLHPKP